MTPRLQAALVELTEALAEAVRLEATAVPAAPDRLLSVDAAAEAMGVARSTLYGELQAGRLRSVKVGRRRLVPARAVADFINKKAGPDRDSGPAAPMEGNRNARRPAA